MRRAIRKLGSFTVLLTPFVAAYLVLVAVGVHPYIAAAVVCVVEVVDYAVGSPVEAFLTDHGPLPAEVEERGSA